MAEKFGYTETELRERGIGKYIGLRDQGYDVKRQAYKDMGVWKAFCDLRKAYRADLTDTIGNVNDTLKNKIAQFRIDTYLYYRAKGKDVVMPAYSTGQVAEQQQKKAGDGAVVPVSAGELLDISQFGANANVEIDPVRDLTWIYNHIAIKDVDPAGAPSPGAYAHLKFVQQNNDNKVDFFTKVYPRIIPSKSQIENLGKFNDDGRSNLKLLERLSAESTDGQAEVSVL